MNPKLNKRFAFAIQRAPMHEPSDGFSKTSVRDQAALLLSIADIAKSEMKSGDRMLWKDDEELPKFPVLLGSAFKLRDKTPREHRSSAVPSMLISAPPVSTHASSRARTVSLDLVEQSRMGANRTPSPLTMTEGQKVPVTPSPMLRKGLRVSTRKRKQPELEELEEEEDDEFDALADNGKSSGPLQGSVPKGVSAKKIHRRKFSWKNYPELEQFLITNREEYLRHSAMNYTIQQKQYNNRLTEKLLELATEHGYIFDEAEFSFVTVRDRIRCYYKSYVQSAKKRGILMGYAARKAGILHDTSAPGDVFDP
ncbi:hypothetical protein FisN_15Lh215 [Fistulifera solaris]|uniref:Uncharacterized protein n=1 Tax=Fistulifera solaris TaxID=1519565 RepID=A0A1Z5JDL5_FISSO|nr:hypothetical protein FisN_15Lh215 [Fistulifera solaris]|eukprot:GAX12093.1 hypothetical protein FisN_15Lh215 [Fistulifera solaris]